MLIVDSFTLRDLHIVKTFILGHITLATDILLSELEKEIKLRLSIKSEVIERDIINKNKVPILCPSCGIPMTCGMVVEGLTINGCKKCRYSELVNKE